MYCQRIVMIINVLVSFVKGQSKVFRPAARLRCAAPPAPPIDPADGPMDATNSQVHRELYEDNGSVFRSL